MTSKGTMSTQKTSQPLSLNITSSSGRIQRPVPKPRKSRDGPVIRKTVNISRSLRASDSSIEKLSDSHTDESLGQLYSRKETKTNKAHTTRSMKSLSAENVNDSLAGLQKSASDSSLSSQKKFVTKHITPSASGTQMAHSAEFEEFTKHGMVIKSPESHSTKQPKAAPRKRVISKQVTLTGNKTAGKVNPHSDEFAQQGLLLKQSLGSDSDNVDSAGKKRSKEISLTRDGKKQVNYSSEFEEYSLSTLQSLGDNSVLSRRDQKAPLEKSKVVHLHSDGKKHVSYTKDVEEFTSQSLENLHQDMDLTNKGKRKPRQVTSSINTTDGEKSVMYSSDFDPHSLGNLRSQSYTSESEQNTATKSRDREVTSWVEFKDGHKHVKHSEDFENFSLGQAIQYTSKPKKGNSSHKQVEYRDGKKSVTYNEDFQNSLQTRYSDDFDSFSESWAMKVKRSSVDSSPVTKHVEYKQGKKHVTYSMELENTLERTMEEVDTATSFREVALEDIEDESYTEDFESTTAKIPATTRSIAAASITEDLEQLSSSTLTPHTSIQTSIQQYVDPYSIQHKDSRGLYSESYASVTSLPRSETAETGDETSPRYRTRTDTFSRTGSLIESETEDESYTMSFSQPTVESVEEYPEIKRQAQEARETFISQKLKLLKTHTGQKIRKVPRPEKPQKLEGAEAKQLKKFIKNKLSVVRTNTEDSPKPESLNRASCQLRGIKPEEPVEGMGISRSAIIRMNMENTLSNMKRAVQDEMHDPRVCPHCSDEMASVAAGQFMWHKKAIVSEKLVKEKMEMQMLQLQDPMWLYAEALRGLPRYSDHREDVYAKLMKPLFESYAATNTSQTQEYNNTTSYI